LFPQNSRKLTDNLKQHFDNLSKKRDMLQNNRSHPEALKAGVWRIELPTTNIKGE